MEYKINYYGSTGELLADETLSYATYDMVQDVVTEQFEEDIIVIKKEVNGREERVILFSNKVAKITIKDAAPRAVQFKGF